MSKCLTALRLEDSSCDVLLHQIEATKRPSPKFSLLGYLFDCFRYCVRARTYGLCEQTFYHQY
jgi:hypothetical protein